MPLELRHRSKANSNWIHSSRLHVVLYTFLLVATPFVLLQNFLVERIAIVSSSSIEIGGVVVRIVPTTALILGIFLLVYFRSHLTRLRILAGVVVLLMIALAQQITDFYFGHNFYDLQQNWHYLAYGIFPFMMYRDLIPRRIPLTKIILITYFSAMSFSCFDETFQMHMSNRVFDMCDIAKDVWGTLLGMVLILLGGNQARALTARWRQIRHPKLKGYTKHPFSLLILIFVFALLFLCFSSLLTDSVHWKSVILLTVGTFALFFILFHASQYKWGKYGLILTLTVGLLVQSYFLVKHHSDGIIHNQYGLTVHKGIPIPFFDLMIYPDGGFRLVDKKHYFNQRDQTFFLKQRTDIILIGKGMYGKGGKGFPEETPVQFIYNKYTHQGTQLIILKNTEACRLFNRLKREGKSVLFILHNTC